MKKSYVFEQLQWEGLLRVSRHIAEADVKARAALKAWRANPIPDTEVDHILAAGTCVAVCEVYGERLRDIISQVMTVYDLQQGIDGYQECTKGWHMYPTGPDQEDPGYCPECMPDPVGAEADRRGDEIKDREAERKWDAERK